MPSPILKRFSVEGASDFPTDMLRVDQCWPATPAYAACLAVAVAVAVAVAGSSPRTVTLETAAKYAPNRQRWIMSGWRVTD